MQSTQRHYNIKLFALLERYIFEIFGNTKLIWNVIQRNMLYTLNKIILNIKYIISLKKHITLYIIFGKIYDMVITFEGQRSQ